MPWKATSLLWPVLVAALLPLDLASTIKRWPQILKRLAALDVAPDSFEAHRSRPRQVSLFRSNFVNC